jgi:hypothetical protein
MEAIDITCLAGINNWNKVVAAAYGISSTIKLTFGFNKLVGGRCLVDLDSFRRAVRVALGNGHTRNSPLHAVTTSLIALDGSQVHIIEHKPV